MTKLLVCAAVSAIAMSAFATEIQPPSKPAAEANATASNVSIVKGGDQAMAVNIKVVAKGQGGKGGNGGQGGSATANPNANGSTPAPAASELKVDYGGKINNVPALSNTYVSTSNTCDGYTGITAAIAGGGFGLNFASKRMHCELRLSGMAYQAMGNQIKAEKMIDYSVLLLCKEDSAFAKIADECREAKEGSTDAPAQILQPAG